jgi:hypothetical protein
MEAADLNWAFQEIETRTTEFTNVAATFVEMGEQASLFLGAEQMCMLTGKQKWEGAPEGLTSNKKTEVFAR